MSPREEALAKALGAVIALLDLVSRGCGHSRPLQLCGVCAMGTRRALAEAKKTMATKIEGDE